MVFRDVSPPGNREDAIEAQKRAQEAQWQEALQRRWRDAGDTDVEGVPKWARDRFRERMLEDALRAGNAGGAAQEDLAETRRAALDRLDEAARESDARDAEDVLKKIRGEDGGKE